VAYLYDEEKLMLHDFGLLYSQEISMTITKRKQKVKKETPIYKEEDIAPLRSRTEKHQVYRTIQGEKDFPSKAYNIVSSPYILYYLGNIQLLDNPILAIVWPRNHSAYASEVLHELFSHLPSRKLVTLSGWAPGVDQQCHARSLKNNIPTIVVLGWGIKWFLESVERDRIQKIIDAGGLILSEFKLDQRPQIYTYPQRNRVVAGLADVIFLPEAGKKSGSLITAEYGLQMHKPVFGVPNSIFSVSSEGINDYIAQGKIHMIQNCKTFLDHHFPHKQEKIDDTKPREELPPQEQELYTYIAHRRACSFSDIMTDQKFSQQELLSLLTLLEMKQYIYQEIPGEYRVVNN